jgi:hypothetical protein
MLVDVLDNDINPLLIVFFCRCSLFHISDVISGAKVSMIIEPDFSNGANCRLSPFFVKCMGLKNPSVKEILVSAIPTSNPI